jgi:hypothetical protein
LHRIEPPYRIPRATHPHDIAIPLRAKLFR